MKTSQPHPFFRWVCLCLFLGLAGCQSLTSSEPPPMENENQVRTNAPSDFVWGDPRPDAPALAARGPHRVGVRTFEAINPGQIDVLNISASQPEPRYDRPLTLEIWYPALIPDGEEEWTLYEDVLGHAGEAERPLIPFTFPGRALRDAPPDPSAAPYPLVIVSHGYPGSRLMFTYLTENLASKGYVVVSIDHTDSTFQDAAEFASTLLNRSLDQLFVRQQVEQWAAEPNHVLYQLVDATNAALIGYSMGGFGALNVAGAGYNPALDPFVPGGHLARRSAGNPEFTASFDPNFKAFVAFAPWGGRSALEGIGVPDTAFWTDEALAAIGAPILFISGSQDDISGYENGVKALFEATGAAEKYLLVYENAQHNVAPNPPPPESYSLPFPEFERYAEPAWDRERMLNINQHFITAFLDQYLKGKETQAYLALPQAAGAAGWEGFLPRTTAGLRFSGGE